MPLAPVTSAQLIRDDAVSEPSALVLARVIAARQAAASRWADSGCRTNAEVSGAHLRHRRFRLPAATTARLTQHIDHGTLSARGYDRVLRLAWTISDLDGRERPDEGDVAEAIYLRGGAI